MSSGGSPPICVLTVGRSGSSLAARVLNVLGVDLGSESSMPYVPTLNPRGGWEQLDVLTLNREILEAWGGSFLHPPALEPGWETAARMDPFRPRIEEFVERHFPNGDRWGFKSPATMLTLPLWRSVLGEFDYVIAVRNPLEVRASAKAGIPQEFDSISLWLRCNCEALRLTAGRPRELVFYDDWFEGDPMAVVERLASFLNGGDGELDEGTRAEAGAVFYGEDRHHSVTDLELAESEEVPVEVRSLYFLMRDLAAAEQRGDERAEALQALAMRMDS